MEKNAMAITITVNPSNGDITVDPTVAHFHPEAMVNWIVTSGTSLTISFKNSSPFGAQLQFQGPGSVEQGIPLNSPKNVRYHYALTATVGNTNYVIPGCPEIVIE